MKTDSHTMLPELLAPAGSPEALSAAVEAGADAVYFGGTEFSGRMRAKNFEPDQLADAIVLLRKYSVSSHITLNTRLRDRELPRVLEAASELYEAGADAFIIADLGLASLIRETMPGVALHASTQLTGISPLDAEMLASLGFDRMICPRELSAEELCRLAASSPISIEAFVHGAHCVSVSGQCLMSWAMGGRSGNRGECAQPCRLPFGCVHGGGGTFSSCAGEALNGRTGSRSGAFDLNGSRREKNIRGAKDFRRGQASGDAKNCGRAKGSPCGQNQWEAKNPRGAKNSRFSQNFPGNFCGSSADTHPLSLKDMCLAAHIPELISSGVASLKIEGRLKNPDYVYGVTRIYRRLLDEGRAADADEIRELSEIFSRDGFTDGYFTGNYSRMCGIRNESTSSSSAPAAVRFQGMTRKVPVMAKAVVRQGEPAMLTLSMKYEGRERSRITLNTKRFSESDEKNELIGRDNVSITVYGDTAEVARTAPLNEDGLYRSLSRLGGTSFSLAREDADISVSGDAWLTAAQVNSLRRDAVEALENRIAETGRRRCPASVCSDKIPHTSELSRSRGGEEPLRLAHFRHASQVPEGILSGEDGFFDAVFLPFHEISAENAKRFSLALPPFAADDGETERLLSEYAGKGGRRVLVSTLSQLRLSVKSGLEPVSSFRFNLTNSASAFEILSMGAKTVTLSPELPIAAMRDIAEKIAAKTGEEQSCAAQGFSSGYTVSGKSSAAVVYGKLPLMLLRRCVAARVPEDVFSGFRTDDTVGRCGRPGGYSSCTGGVLTDRTGTEFPVLPVEGCMNEVLNSRPIWSADTRIGGGLGGFFLFTDESREEAEEIIDAYRKRLPPPSGKSVKRL